LTIWKDHPAVFDEPDWLNNLYRRAHAEEINAAVEAYTRRFTKEDLTNLLQPKGIPCIAVNTPLQFANDEQVQSRGFMATVEHAGFGGAEQPASPFVIDGARPALRSVPLLDSWRESGGRQPFSAPQKTVAPGNGPLDGMRIVSFDHVLAGPYGTTILAELGADVIKIESRKGGMDPFRFFGTGEDPNLSPRFLEFNRNKRSFTVNLKHPKGQNVLHDLVAKADAVLDNYSVDVVGRIGLAYEDLCKVKPDIINLRMPGLGTTGPKRHYSTVGVNITAFTGLTYLWNHPGVTDPPIGSQAVYPDYASGVLCAIIIISACSIATGRKKARSSIWPSLRQRRSWSAQVLWMRPLPAAIPSRWATPRSSARRMIAIPARARTAGAPSPWKTMSSGRHWRKFSVVKLARINASRPWPVVLSTETN
jgi:crotonobetainyl-CoA:carnitine CoA-transferase CaiB-like acyl-CoA transferase